MTTSDPADPRRACAEMFEQHRREGFGGVFHVPDAQTYPALFAWDSGYHALCLRHIDPRLAVRELSTLYAANRLADGLLSHQRFVPEAGDVQSLIEELFGPMFVGDRTPFVDPPVAAYAAARLSRTLGRSAVHLLDSALGHLRALAAHRVVDGCALPVVLHPFETGTEGNPFIRKLPGHPAPFTLAEFKDLTVSALAAGMSPNWALSAGHPFVLYDPTVCGWYLLALEEVAAACSASGRSEEEAWAHQLADSVADDVVSFLWCEPECLFGAHDLVSGETIHGVGAMGLIPAAARTIAERGLAITVAERHLGFEAPMWGPLGYAAGTVRAGAGVRDFVQWDGNAVWGATVYWAHSLALRVDRLEVARRLRQQLEDLVRQHGFREFYDASTGEPGGAGALSGFTWPALMLEMFAGEAEDLG